MLATLVREPFNREGWIYEEKYDGYRIVAYKEGHKVQLLSRNSIDRTRTFSPVAAAIGKLPSRTLLLDGEVVVFDRKRVSRFQLLQQGNRVRLRRVDCLYQNGKVIHARASFIATSNYGGGNLSDSSSVFDFLGAYSLPMVFKPIALQNERDSKD